MEIKASWTLRSTPDEVYEDAITTTYQDQKCASAGALDFTTHVEERGAGTHTTIAQRVMSSGEVPELVKKLLGETVDVTETIAWGPRDEDGGRRGELGVTFKGQPITMTGHTFIRPHGAGSEVGLIADLTARIPIIGARIERLGAPEILKAIKAEEQTAAQWDQRRHP